MNARNSLIFSSVLLCGLLSAGMQTAHAAEDTSSLLPKSAQQRSEVGKIRRNHNFTDLGQEYTDFTFRSLSSASRIFTPSRSASVA